LFIHHAQKLQSVAGAVEFQEIEFAGKCGTLLSALTADEQAILRKQKVEAIARSAGLNIHTDLPAILHRLEENQLIDQSDSGDVTVLGLTTPTVLTHASDIFRATNPTETELAAVFVAEETRSPALSDTLATEVSDTFRLSADETRGVIDRSVEIGFVDAQKMESQRRLLFNGNLFVSRTRRRSRRSCSRCPPLTGRT
jgi:hypothetical protein